jgi:hypothetical protein
MYLYLSSPVTFSYSFILSNFLFGFLFITILSLFPFFIILLYRCFYFFIISVLCLFILFIYLFSSVLSHSFFSVRFSFYIVFFISVYHFSFYLLILHHSFPDVFSVSFCHCCAFLSSFSLSHYSFLFDLPLVSSAVLSQCLLLLLFSILLSIYPLYTCFFLSLIR